MQVLLIRGLNIHMREHTIGTTLERLDQKPVIWRGLTIDELLIVVCVSLISSCTVACLVIEIIFGRGSLGLIPGILLTVLMVRLMANYIEGAKKKYGETLMWVYLKKKIQRRGLFRFYGLMTNKVKWDMRLSNTKRQNILSQLNNRS